MSIVPLKKITFCGTVKEKGMIMQSLQKLGCMHLVPLKTGSPQAENTGAVKPERAYKALRYLSDTPKKRRFITDINLFHIEEVVDRALANHDRTRQAVDERDSLVKRIQQVEPWGDFTFPSLDELAGIRFWFYTVSSGKMKQLAKVELPWQTVHHDQSNHYIVVLSKEEPEAGIMPMSRTHIGAVSLSELKRQLNDLEIELEDLAVERESLTRWLLLLTKSLVSAENQEALARATQETLDIETFFAVQGWVGEHDTDKIKDFAHSYGLAVVVEPPGPQDYPPTLLDNPKPLSGGEEMVHFYQEPGYKTWDPSITVFFSFALFFAMIMSDAGYASLIGLILLFYWKRMGKSDRGQRLRLLGAVITGVSLAYGVLAGSFFGKSPSENSLLGYFHVIDINDFQSMMRLSVVVGTLHIVLANCVMVWLRRKNLTALGSVGWIVTVLSGLVLWIWEPDSVIFLAGKWAIVVGLLLVFLFTSERPLKKPVDILWRMVHGFKALTNLSKAFGDVLSYMRLFALGLASASLAVVFNQLAVTAAKSFPGIGLLVGLLVLLLGHSLNFILAIMSGVVHGMRLNFIEFYNWSISEEGYPFRAFSKKEIKL